MFHRAFFMTALLLVFATTTSAQDAQPAAIKVYGQLDFASNVIGHSATGLNAPVGLAVDKSGGLYIADSSNSRVLYFAADGDTTADRVYGQHDNLQSYIQNFDGVGGSGAPSADSLSYPVALALDGSGGLYVTDRDNHRVLYYASDGNTTADQVYGQLNNFTTNPANNDDAGGSGAPSDANFGVFAFDVLATPTGDLFVSDSSNNRVLRFYANGYMHAYTVYGQNGDLGMRVQNNDGTGKTGTPSADGLNFPRGLAMDTKQGLYVADQANSRVLYFANNDDLTADQVYGHSGSFTSGVKNDNSGQTPEQLTYEYQGQAYPVYNVPFGLDVAHQMALVKKRRQSSDFIDPTNPDFGVISWAGQPNLLEPVFRVGPPTPDNLDEPASVALDSKGGLYVADEDNNRVLYFADDGNTTADWVFGQFGSLTFGIANNDGTGASGAPSAQNLNEPQFVMVSADGSLYISDTGNNRVLVLAPDVLP